MMLASAFKKAVGGAALGAVLLAPSLWSSFTHDQAIKAGFRSELYKDSSSRMLKITTGGVTREGELVRGAAMPNVVLGFYNHPSSAFLIAAKPEAACWYVNLQVTEGQDHLPFWQKIFGGAEYERTFANAAFSGWMSYNCAPVANGTVGPAPKPAL